MGYKPGRGGEEPREWRRRVLVPARLRSNAGWGDARILNVSSRGMMVHTPHCVDVGSIIELRRGAQVYVAQVMWKDGSRAGLMSDSILPLTDILCMSEPASPEAEFEQATPSMDRAMDRDGGLHRMRGRLIELAMMTAIACSIAVATTSLVGGIIGPELDRVRIALGD